MGFGRDGGCALSPLGFGANGCLRVGGAALPGNRRLGCTLFCVAAADAAGGGAPACVTAGFPLLLLLCGAGAGFMPL